jgi:hypothetical protein
MDQKNKNNLDQNYFETNNPNDKKSNNDYVFEPDLDLEGNFNKLVTEFEEAGGYNPQIVQERVRTELARVFVYGFFGLLVVTIIFVPLYNIFAVRFTESESLIINLPETLTLIGSVVGTSLGFVTGFYFKTLSDENDS